MLPLAAWSRKARAWTFGWRKVRLSFWTAALGLLGFHRFWSSALTGCDRISLSSTLVSRSAAVVQPWVTVIPGGR